MVKSVDFAVRNVMGGVSRGVVSGEGASDYIAVFNGPESLAGKFANIKITRSMPLTLFGELTV